MIPKQTKRILYFAFYHLIYQYSLLVWGGLDVTILKTCQTYHNNIVRICLNKCTPLGSTIQNYYDLDYY